MLVDLRLRPHLRELTSALAAYFGERNLEAYATGGFLRDVLLGEDSVRDLDIIVRADPLTLGPELADAFAGSAFPLDEERRLVRVMLPERGVHLDITPLTGSLEQDLLTRDFTVDAMAAVLAEVAAGRAELVDPTGGLPDLQARAIRAVSEEAFRKDPLRLLRGVRLASQLNFAIEPETAAMISRHAALVSEAAVERQREELMLTLGTPRGGAGLRLLESLCLLAHVLPELDITRGVEQPKEHYWDVFNHCLHALVRLEMLLGQAQPVEEPERTLWGELWSRLSWWEDGRAYWRQEVAANAPRYALLKLGALLHDIGKPQTKTFDQTGRMRFFGHGDAGAEIAERLLRRLRFSSRETAMISAMIKTHLRPVQMAQQGAPTDRAIYRFFRDTGEAGVDTLFLSLADHLATVGPRINMDGWREHVAVVDHILRRRFTDSRLVEPPKLLRGDDLIEELGLEPGPLVGALLEAVREAQAAGEVGSREEALALARRRLEHTAGTR